MRAGEEGGQEGAGREEISPSGGELKKCRFWINFKMHHETESEPVLLRCVVPTRDSIFLANLGIFNDVHY